MTLQYRLRQLSLLELMYRHELALACHQESNFLLFVADDAEQTMSKHGDGIAAESVTIEFDVRDDFRLQVQRRILNTLVIVELDFFVEAAENHLIFGSSSHYL